MYWEVLLSGRMRLKLLVVISDCFLLLARCPYCEHEVAYFQQIQIRSADEPMTTFYRCANCEKIWSDNN